MQVIKIQSGQSTRSNAPLCKKQSSRWANIFFLYTQGTIRGSFGWYRFHKSPAFQECYEIHLFCRVRYCGMLEHYRKWRSSAWQDKMRKSTLLHTDDKTLRRNNNLFKSEPSFPQNGNGAPGRHFEPQVDLNTNYENLEIWMYLLIQSYYGFSMGGLIIQVGVKITAKTDLQVNVIVLLPIRSHPILQSKFKWHILSFNFIVILKYIQDYIWELEKK